MIQHIIHSILKKQQNFDLEYKYFAIKINGSVISHLNVHDNLINFVMIEGAAHWRERSRNINGFFTAIDIVQTFSNFCLAQNYSENVV